MRDDLAVSWGVDPDRNPDHAEQHEYHRNRGRCTASKA
jgi:hypothetical protein